MILSPSKSLQYYDKGVEVQPYSDTYEEFHLAYRYGDEVTYPLDWKEPLRLECTHFLEVIRDHTPLRSDARHGLQVVQILDAAHKSLLNGHNQETIEWE